MNFSAPVPIGLAAVTVEPPISDRSIHLLYVPTLSCNLSCSYCYLGKQTSEAALKLDSQRAVHTLHHTLNALQNAGVLAFNISLHGGEVTTLPPAVMGELFEIIRGHYLAHFDALNALGHKNQSHTSKPICINLLRYTNYSIGTKYPSVPALICR